MTLSTTMFQSDLSFMISDFPTSVTWNGSAYSCIVNDITSEDNLEMGGIMESHSFEVVISLADFSSYPAVGDRVTIAGTNYRITGTSDSPDGIARTLTCSGDLE